MAAGREPEALAADIREKLSVYVKNPNVTVILLALKGHESLSRIRVVGSVEENISIPYSQGMIVLEAGTNPITGVVFSGARRKSPV